MSDTVLALDGTPLPIPNLPLIFNYTGTSLNYIQTTYPNNAGVETVYRKTFTYTGDNVTAISQWTPQ